MSRDDTFMWLLGGAVLAWILYNRSGIGSTLESGAETVTAALTGWQAVNDGPVWVPVINQTEDAYAIPPMLLARQAYQESHFRRAIIDGTQPSPAGALGILQLMPQWFTTVRVPVPFSTSDTQAQITEAGREMSRLYNAFADWGLALAAYNDGESHVKDYLAGVRTLPQETQNYVAQVLADVPVASVMSA